jgi:hypothetical protein
MAFLHRVADDIRALQDLLKRYDYGDDGLAIYKELLQNADDAGASTLQLHLLERGLPAGSVENSLLTGPALVVINDGHFRPVDALNMRYATGTSKSRTVGAVGRFGLGQKSVFHLCESWLCIGSSREHGIVPCNVDPWEDESPLPNDPSTIVGDPKFPDWPRFSEADQEAIRTTFSWQLQGEKWFLLWLPLRLDKHRRPGSGLISEWRPGVEDLEEHLGDLAPIARLLPQMNNIQRVEVLTHREPGDMAVVRCAELATRSTTLSRPGNNDPLDRAFRGTAESPGGSYQYFGRERVDNSRELRALTEHESWPVTFEQEGGTPHRVPERVVAHGGVTVVVGEATDGEGALHIDWSVFLPLAAQQSGRALKTRRRIWVYLHGYFFPDHGRRTIVGLDSPAAASALERSADFEAEWNRRLRDAVVLPELLPALLDALRPLEQDEQNEVVRVLRSHPLLADHLDAICPEFSLARTLRPGQPLELIPCSARLLPVPPGVVMDREVRRLLERAEDGDRLRLVLDRTPRLTAAAVGAQWVRAPLRVALAPPMEVELRRPSALQLVVYLLESVDDVELCAEVADELLRRVVLEHGHEVLGYQRLTSSWARLAGMLRPGSVLGTQAPEALAHIADLPTKVLVLPKALAPQGDEVRVRPEDGRSLLEALARVISRTEADVPEAEGDSAGRLAAEIVNALGPSTVLADPQFSTLPVFRGWSSSEGQEISISPAEILKLAGLGLAFGGSGGFARQKCKALYAAIAAPGVDVLLVSEGVAAALELPAPRPDALLAPLLESTRPAADPALRRPLLQDCVDSRSGVRPPQARGTGPLETYSRLGRGLRLLLHGEWDKRHHRSELWTATLGSEVHPVAVREVLSLAGESWRLLSGSLCDGLSHEWMRALGIASFGKHRLVEQLGSLSETQLAQLPSDLDEAACRSLLRAASDAKNVWTALPIHRATNGRRTAVTTGRTWLENRDWALPAALDREVDLIQRSDDALGADAQKRHLPLWSPLVQVKRCLSQPSPPRAVVVLDGLAELEPEEWPLEQLRATRWLPVEIAEQIELVAPSSLLGLPPGAAIRLSGCLRGHTEAFFPPADVLAEVRQHPRFPRVVDQLALSGAELVEAVALELANREPEGLALGKGAPDIGLELALGSEALCRHPGWAVVGELARLEGAADEVGRTLVPALSYEMRFAEQVALLRELAREADTQAGCTRQYLFALKQAAQRTDFVDEVLPLVRVPNRAGGWVEPFRIARTDDNWAPEYRLASVALPILKAVLGRPGAGGRDPSGGMVSASVEASARQVRDGSSVLETYFEPLFRRGLQRDAAGLLLVLLGRGFHALAGMWLNGTTPEALWNWLLHDATKDNPNFSADHRWLLDARYGVEPAVCCGDLIPTTSLLGTPLQARLATGAAAETIFAALDGEGVGTGRPYLLRILPVDPALPLDDLTALLQRSVEALVRHRLRRELRDSVFARRWEEYSQSGQVLVAAVRKQILGHLAVRLEPLQPKRQPDLAAALAEFKRAEHTAAEANASKHLWQDEKRKAEDSRLAAETKLIALVEDDPVVQAFLLGQIRRRLREYQYDEDSVLWELLQNADDASVQLRQMRSKETDLDCVGRRLRIEVGQDKIRLTHWGRPINQHTMAGFHEGREHGWDLDLLNMMVLNTSDKDEDQGVTGRFGLGFKSVHLVSDRPRIGSGQLGFEVVAGMLPVTAVSPIDGEDWSEGVPTVFELPLADPGVLTKTVTDFETLVGLAPVFCHALRQVEWSRGGRRTVFEWCPKEVPGVPGLRVGIVKTGLGSGSREVRLVHLRSDSGTELVLGLENGEWVPLPASIPTVWRTAPTKEQWDIGILLNGPVALDSGRSRVALDRDETTRVFADGGFLISSAFQSLARVLRDSWESTAPMLGLPASGSTAATRRFWQSLWEVLGRGLRPGRSHDAEDRTKLLLRMHRSGRGLSGLIRQDDLLPTGLAGPLETLTRTTRVGAIASRELLDPEMVACVQDWNWCEALLRPGHIISEQVAAVVRLLEPGWRCKHVGLVDLLEGAWTEEDAGEARCRAEQLCIVSSFLDDRMPVESREAVGEWMSRLRFPSEAGSWAPARSLLVPRLEPEVRARLARAGSGERIRASEDEWRRAQFAPQERLLSGSFCAEAAAVAFFLSCRERLEGAGFEAMEGWVRLAVTDHAREAALRYCIEGTLARELRNLLRVEPIPWFPDRQALATSPLVGSWSMADRVDLQAALFPAKKLDPEPQEVHVAQSDDFWARLSRWWGDRGTRREVVDTYERSAWPAWLRADLRQGLLDGSREQWLALLVLGASRGIGRKKAGHHRAFLEAAKDQGWWDRFLDPSDPAAWMETLRRWQDEATARLPYSSWMSLFPFIYQFSRHLDVYRRLLTTAGRRPAEMSKLAVLLAPRVDDALSGTGTQFDAPPAPLNMGLHWALRELVRLGVVEPESHVLPYCWVPGRQVLELLEHLGMWVDYSDSNEEKAAAIHEFLEEELGDEDPTLHRCFDIPLRRVASDPRVRQRLGLEE